MDEIGSQTVMGQWWAGQYPDCACLCVPITGPLFKLTSDLGETLDLLFPFLM